MARTTADEQLERILYLVPAAGGRAGRSLATLADALGVPPEQVLRDLEEVTARAYYHPAGSVDALQITIEGDRVRVWTTGEFRRPVRLSPLEALALALGLRTLAAAEPARRDELLEFAQRMEGAVASTSPEDLLKRFAVDDGAPDDGGVLGLLRRAAAEHRRCRIRYVVSGASEAETRVICPYTVAWANGAWYVIAHCTSRNGVRLFREDRIVEAGLLDETFELPPDFDPTEYVRDGRIYRAAEEVEVVVRYSPRIARWIREKGPVEEQNDGSVVVRLRVADPRWLVRHVLRYGTEAEVLEPREFRTLVAAAARRIATSD